MNDRELMQQALDALTCSGEDDDPGHRCTHCDDYVDRNGSLRAALRERLAQPEQCNHCGGTGDVSGEYPGVVCHECSGSGVQAKPAQQQQEPVAERFEAMHAKGDVWITTIAAAALSRNTSPPASKPWVGLDAGDWNKIVYTSEFRAGADWADALLREKNTR